MLRIVWWVCGLLLAVAVAGCTSSAGSGESSPGTGQLGDSCQRTEDCASGLCVRVDARGGICTQACTSDMGCPAADNWACLTSDDGTKIQLCACRKLADSEVCGDGIDNDCNGKVDDCRVCAGRAVPNDDPQNCGACGNSCVSGQSCTDGACVCPKEEATACSTGCADLKTDSQNCGACGVSCGSGRSCEAGVCSCPTAGDSFCAGSGCTSLESDPQNCGKCGNACVLGQVCQAGACTCEAKSAPDFCAGVGCVDEQTDPKNCGGCGKLCSVGFVCAGGACVCPTGQTSCGGNCVDTQSDAANCGACGSACGSAQACSGGTCGCTSFGYTVCGGSCSNTATDRANCGACGKTCGANEVCSGGACSCPSGVYCGGICTDTTSDPGNCGACGNTCSNAQSCVSGQCHCQGFGLTACGASCVSETTDPANCGACGAACPSAETCSSGHCGCAVAGQTYCAATNKCVDPSSDALNCGACGTACSAGQICAKGVCACPATGALYCASAAACVDTLSNTQDCGGCDKKCSATEICASGACTCPASGQTFCDNANACVSLGTDNANCGACNRQCPAATACTGGSCVCTQAGLSLCGSTCENLQNDAKNCGSCGNVCGGTYACVSGQCKCQDPTPGTEVQLTNDATIDHTAPVAAWDGTHVGFVYQASDSSNFRNVHFALLNPNGTLVSDVNLTNFTVYPSNLYHSPVVTWSGTEYGVAWIQRVSDDDRGSDVWFQRVGADGAVKAPAVMITAHSAANQYDDLDLAWSASYGGYGLAYVKQDTTSFSAQIVFRRIGATGAAPEAELGFTGASSIYGGNSRLAVAPDGSWAVASTEGGDYTVLSLINAAGTSETDVRLGSAYEYSYTPAELVYDGAGWLTTWTGVGQTQEDSLIYLNRGSVANSPFHITTTATTDLSDVGARLVMIDGTLALGFTIFVNNVGLQYALQRFAIPSTGSSTLRPISSVVDILSTPTLYSETDIALVPTGASSLLAIWVDNRATVNGQLYAKPIDLHSCP